MGSGTGTGSGTWLGLARLGLAREALWVVFHIYILVLVHSCSFNFFKTSFLVIFFFSSSSISFFLGSCPVLVRKKKHDLHGYGVLLLGLGLGLVHCYLSSLSFIRARAVFP